MSCINRRGPDLPPEPLALARAALALSGRDAVCYRLVGQVGSTSGHASDAGHRFTVTQPFASAVLEPMLRPLRSIWTVAPGTYPQKVWILARVVGGADAGGSALAGVVAGGTVVVVSVMVVVGPIVVVGPTVGVEPTVVAGARAVVETIVVVAVEAGGAIVDVVLEATSGDAPPFSRMTP